jgi:hypothetical protein
MAGSSADGMVDQQELNRAGLKAKAAVGQSDILATNADAFSASCAAVNIEEYSPDVASILVANAIAHEQTKSEKTIVPAWDRAWMEERAIHAGYLRDIFGNPFRPLPPRPEAIAPLAEQIYAGAWDQMPILGEWLQEHGYWSEGEHCLDPSIQHVKGCWVVDWVTGRE